MKNFTLLTAACALLLMLGSCGNGQNKQEKENNQPETVLPTPDLAFFELQGPVKSCEGVVAPSGLSFECVQYDRSGKITSVDGDDPFALEEPWSELNEETSTMEDHCRWNRDDQGKIVSFDCDWSYANFTWKDGRVSSLMRSHEDLTYKHEFEYDAEGRLVKETLYNGTIDEVENDEMILERVIEYTYLDFDDHGNWTRRKERFTDYEINYEDEEEVTRSIQYYE